MHFAFLPPEVNSARIYAGPGAGSMLSAAWAWDELANELHTTASNLESVVSELTSEPWEGPSAASMAASAASQVAWLSTAAAQAGQTSAQVRAAVVAYEAAHAMTVPPPVIASNRAQLMSLIATNVLGQNTAAIAATEVAYAEMWAQDVAVMYGYAGTSRAASEVTPFAPPRPTTDQGGVIAQSAAAARAAATSAGHAQAALASGTLMSAVPNALRALTAAPFGLTGFSDFTNVYDLVELGSEFLGNGFGLIGVSGAAGFISEAEHNAVGPGAGEKAPAAPQRPAGTGKAARPHAAATSVSAHMGGGGSRGRLSVPAGWTSAAPEMRLAAVESPIAGSVPGPRSGLGPFGDMPLFGGTPLMAFPSRGASGSREDRPVDEGAPGSRVRAGAAVGDREQRSRTASSGRPSGTTTELREITEVLGRLAELRDRGALTDTEFVEQKQRLLGGR